MILAVDMGRAGLNTVLGIGIVFTVLIFICIIISCFKLINKTQVKKPETPVKAPEPVPEITEEDEDLTDDLQLIAVITAAITAYEEAEGGYVPEDGLVIRSIRKVNRNKWLNA